MRRRRNTMFLHCDSPRVGATLVVVQIRKKMVIQILEKRWTLFKKTGCPDSWGKW
jgi:hypothetical protein